MNTIEYPKIEDYAGPDTVLTPKDYAMAFESQCACNLSGITHWFDKVISKIWDEAQSRKKGTDWVNQHPICRLFAEQMAYLSSGQGCSASNYYQATDYVFERSKQ
jgi:hypothetical protein